MIKKQFLFRMDLVWKVLKEKFKKILVIHGDKSSV